MTSSPTGSSRRSATRTEAPEGFFFKKVYCDFLLVALFVRIEFAQRLSASFVGKLQRNLYQSSFDCDEISFIRVTTLASFQGFFTKKTCHGDGHYFKLSKLLKQSQPQLERLRVKMINLIFL